MRLQRPVIASRGGYRAQTKGSGGNEIKADDPHGSDSSGMSEDEDDEGNDDDAANGGDRSGEGAPHMNGARHVDTAGSTYGHRRRCSLHPQPWPHLFDICPRCQHHFHLGSANQTGALSDVVLPG